MNDSLITRLVLGEPRTVTLGRAVGQNIARAKGTALRWSGGRWVQECEPRSRWLARMFPGRKPQAPVLAILQKTVQLRLRPGIALFAAATLLLLGTLAIEWPALGDRSVEPGDLPVAASSSVRVLHASYAPPRVASEPAAADPSAFEGQAKAGAAPPPLPFTAPAELPSASLHRASAQAAPRQAVQTARSRGPAGKPLRSAPATPAPAPQPAPQAAAVFLDEAALRAARVPVLTNAPERTIAPPGQRSSARSITAVAAASAPARGHVPPAAAELIAISPDGKLAVFTDPQTRLPRQFQLGEQLPGGDLIRSIDAKTGRVLSSTREYSLD